jgi:hypothetical protein
MTPSGIDMLIKFEEVFALLGCYAALIASWLPPFGAACLSYLEGSRRIMGTVGCIVV